MAKRPRPAGSKPLELRAAEEITRRHKVKKPLLVDRLEDRLRTPRKKIHCFRAVAEADANGPQYTVVLDGKGALVDMEAAEERTERRYFAPPPLDVDISTRPPLRPAATAGIDPSANDLVLNQGEELGETVTVTIPAGSGVPKADVYFLADTTGSMGSVIDAVKAGAGNILAALGGLAPDFAFGVGNYKDFPGDAYAFQHQLNPSSSAAAAQNAIGNWSASGGGDFPEAQLYALDSLGEPPGGAIGWRPGARRIIVWFGDAPGHEPVCPAISGAPAAISTASVTARLAGENIAVLAISTANPGLDADPKLGAFDYSPACGPPGGSPGQATAIANATGGRFVAGIDPGTVVQTIIDLVTEAVGTIGNVKLVAGGASAPFVTAIAPPDGYGPLAGDREHRLPFKVTFTGVAACRDEEQVFAGSIDVVADGVAVARKRVRIRIPACEPEYRYSVKFLCGGGGAEDCGCVPTGPGAYATEINIHNFHAAELAVRKRFIPLVLAGAAPGRAPRSTGPMAEVSVTLPPQTATMDDCRRIAGMLFGGPPAQTQALTVGFLEIVSPAELAVTAVYTVSDPLSGRVSLDVEQIEGRRTR